MMKRIVLMCLLALALPLAAFADSSVDFQNNDGTLSGALSGTSSGLSLSGSVLTQVRGFDGMGPIQGTNLGSVSFSTSTAVSSITLGNGDTVTTFAAGGSFLITGNGSNGVPDGTIFSGTFSKPPVLLGVQNANGQWQYTLTGSVSGTYEGHTVFGMTTQLTTNTGHSRLARNWLGWSGWNCSEKAESLSLIYPPLEKPRFARCFHFAS
jgi:hypothetical protein